MNGNGSVLSGSAIAPDRGAMDSDGVGEAACRRILDAVGLRWRDGEVARLHRWLGLRLRALRLPSTAAYAELILSEAPEGRRECAQLIGQFSTGETYFFRDPGLFARLEASILPDLLARRAGQRSLRIWSAGCASGEEAYSLAMLIDEMRPRLSGWDVRIVGSDVNGEAIERARTGIYGPWSFRALDAQRTERYFRKCRRGRQVIEPLRAIVSFERGNLLRDGPPGGGFDLVLCRNVLIYLSTPAVARIVETLSAAVGEKGYLIPGHGELLGCVTPQLVVRAFPEVVVYRKVSAASALPVPAAAPGPADRAMAATAIGDRRRVLPPASVRPVSGPVGAHPKPPPSASPPDANAALAQAWREADRGAAEAAQVACERVLATAPLDPRPYYLLAQLAQERGASDEARALLRKVLYLEPHFVVAQLELADLCERIGERDGALRLRQQARRELESLPPDSVLGAPPQTTAGALLRALQAGGGAVGEPQGGRDA